jgi:hypothetical protein
MSSEISVPVIDRVMELTPGRTLEVNGYTYLDKDKSLTLQKPPCPAPMKVSTLDGLVDLLEANFESEYRKQSEQLVHVVSHEKVEFLSKVSDRFGYRQEFIVANRIKPEQEFQFGVYLPQEKFVIALRSLFVQDASVDELVAIAGNLAAKAEVQQHDDGITQQVTMKAGVHLVTEKVLKPKVDLKPYRTFLEVEQPSSTYIFRVKTAEGGSTCALFEADGGMWKLTAMENIKTWFANRLKGSAAEGLSDIPVVA